MKYAKVQQALPKYKYVRELDPELDSLLYDIFDDDQLIVDRQSSLDQDLIDDLQRREIRKIWVRTITYSWMPYEDALAENVNIVETKEAHPVKDHLLKNFGDIKGIQSLEKIIEAYEEESLDEMIYSQLVSVRSHLPDLKEQENSITEDLHAIEDDDLRFRIMDVLRSRNPRLDPEDYPEEVQSLIKDISKFLTELREVKDKISELIMEIGPEKTPELAEGTLDQKDFTPLEEPITDAVDFALELYDLDEEVYPEFLVEGLCGRIRELIEEVVEEGRWNEDRLLDVADELSMLRSELPNLLWVLPFEHATDDQLLEQAIGRLLLHAHVWPQDVFGDNAPRYFGAELLCDLGMVEVPETFWNHGDDLSEDQWVQVKKHPEFGRELLEEVSGLPEEVPDLIAGHHYRGDGHGYPESLDEWSTDSRKLALVDAFDSLTTPRHRREALAPRDAFTILDDDFSPEVSGLLDELRESVGYYPPGSMIRLDNNTVALVESSGNDLDEPNYRELVMDDETIKDLGSLNSLAETEASLKSSSRQRVAPWSIRRVRWRLDDSIDLNR